MKARLKGCRLPLAVLGDTFCYLHFTGLEVTKTKDHIVVCCNHGYEAACPEALNTKLFQNSSRLPPNHPRRHLNILGDLCQMTNRLDKWIEKALRLTNYALQNFAASSCTDTDVFVFVTSCSSSVKE